MPQMRSCGLAVISIEYDAVNQLDFNKVIKNVSTIEAIKIAFF